MIKVDWIFLIVCILTYFVVEALKIFLENKGYKGWTKFIPYMLLLVSILIYGFILKDIFNAILNGLALTAFTVFIHDSIKPVVDALKRI